MAPRRPVAVITVDFGTAPDAIRPGERTCALVTPPAAPCAPAKPATTKAARGAAVAPRTIDAHV